MKKRLYYLVVLTVFVLNVTGEGAVVHHTGKFIPLGRGNDSRLDGSNDSRLDRYDVYREKILQENTDYHQQRKIQIAKTIEEYRQRIMELDQKFTLPNPPILGDIQSNLFDPFDEQTKVAIDEYKEEAAKYNVALQDLKASVENHLSRLRYNFVKRKSMLQSLQAQYRTQKMSFDANNKPLSRGDYRSESEFKRASNNWMIRKFEVDASKDAVYDENRLQLHLKDLDTFLVCRLIEIDKEIEISSKNIQDTLEQISKKRSKAHRNNQLEKLDNARQKIEQQEEQIEQQSNDREIKITAAKLWVKYTLSNASSPGWKIIINDFKPSKVISGRIVEVMEGVGYRMDHGFIFTGGRGTSLFADDEISIEAIEFGACIYKTVLGGSNKIRAYVALE